MSFRRLLRVCKPALRPLTPALLAALPWAFNFSYSRGYDLFLWIYNAWFLRQNLLEGHMPNWSPFSSCGQPFFKVAGLTDGLLLALLMYFFDTFAAVQVFVVLGYALAACGMYRLARSLELDPLASTLAAGAYVLSWFTTFTVYFQAYLSNFFAYALLPWFVHLYGQAADRNCLTRAWGAGALLALAIATNPQVAIKMGVIGSLWALWRPLRGGMGDRLQTGALVALVALGLAAFNIVSALCLRSEILSMSYRQNTYVGPFALIAIPVYGLQLLAEPIIGGRWLEMPLWELLYSEYPGTGVVLLALLAWKSRARRTVLVLASLVVAAYALYFFVFPLLPASAWLGTSHNLMIAPAFGLALLAGCGFAWLRSQLLARWGRGRAAWGYGAVFAAVLAELYGVCLGLYAWGATRTFPARLPEVEGWRVVAEEIERAGGGGRFYSFNPDHTVDLFPVLTGAKTANVIELRHRLPEYQSYLDALEACAQDEDCGPGPGTWLSLLDVEYVDLPRKFYEYRGPIHGRGEYEQFLEGLRIFDRDPDLERLYQRQTVGEDLGRDALATGWDLLQPGAGRPAPEAEVAQVIYRNRTHYAAFVAPNAVAIVGSGLAAERTFEEIVRSERYTPDRVLYLLLESPEQLDARQQRALAGYLLAAGENRSVPGKVLSPRELRDLYERSISLSPDPVPLLKAESEKLHLVLEQPLERDGFLFVSQQRFADWHAYDQDGERLDVHKAGAGLTAVFLKAGDRQVMLQYELTPSERWARGFSLAFVLLSLAGLAHVRAGKRLRKPANETIYIIIDRGIER